MLFGVVLTSNVRRVREADHLRSSPGRNRAQHKPVLLWSVSVFFTPFVFVGGATTR